MRRLPNSSPESVLRHIKPARSFLDVFIPAETNASLLRLHRERQRLKELAMHGIKPRNRLLFHGPPGNGKTATAEALANLYKLPLYIANYAEMVNCWLGDSEKAVVAVFTEVHEKECIMFMDEADSLLSSRTSARQSADHARNTCVNLILTNLDRLSAKTVFIAATNRVEDLDSALDRRFDAKFEFPNPTVAQKTAFTEILLRRFPVVAKARKQARVKGVINAAVARDPSFAVLEKSIIDLAREIILGQ